jgi:hypothetical protein
MGLSTVARAY